MVDFTDKERSAVLTLEIQPLVCKKKLVARDGWSQWRFGSVSWVKEKDFIPYINWGSPNEEPGLMLEKKALCCVTKHEGEL